MEINESNYQKGYKAMASVLLLYYHLIGEGGLGFDCTVYIDPDDFNGFSYLNVEVIQGYGIEEKLLREGAVIYLLCDLDDMISEHEESYLHAGYTKRILAEFDKRNMSCIPEVKSLIELVRQPQQLDWEAYGEIKLNIFQKYVLGHFQQLIGVRSN